MGGTPLQRAQSEGAAPQKLGKAARGITVMVGIRWGDPGEPKKRQLKLILHFSVQYPEGCLVSLFGLSEGTKDRSLRALARVMVWI